VNLSESETRLDYKHTNKTNISTAPTIETSWMREDEAIGRTLKGYKVKALFRLFGFSGSGT